MVVGSAMAHDGLGSLKTCCVEKHGKTEKEKSARSVLWTFYGTPSIGSSWGLAPFWIQLDANWIQIGVESESEST